ncbi:MAG: SdiA-regulated domain-containing protein [Labilithrix sp.]|nr:SdiA-regulated domain-containing protein [Labilithrix sp.]
MRSRLLAAALLTTACAASPERADAGEGLGEDELRASRIETVAATPLPIVEVSGLGQRRVSGVTEYLAVGDASTTLVSFSVEPGDHVADVRTHDLSRLFGKRASQWEAVAGDGAGRVFVLAESTDTLSVIAPDLTRVTHRFRIAIPKKHELAAAWKAEANSRGEGLVLLSNGHVLVAKEKRPSAVVELGPKGSVAEGYRPELALGDRAFPLPEEGDGDLVPLAHWLLKDKDTRLLGDVSDLAVDAEGRLFLLSDQGRAVARVERTLDVGESKIDLKAVYSLPPRVAKPEGLTFADGRAFVATDGKDVRADALFALEPLDGERD